jgi:diacylglycerol kinase (ATP)
MKFAKVLHNPGAGDGEHSIDDLAARIKAAGYDCTCESTKEVDGEQIASKEVDFVVLAGGDGTVRKIAKHLLKENLPIGLLPMGTANNIAKTLALPENTEQIIRSWADASMKSFDVGKVYGLGKRRFFLEGIGYGVFPRLMKEMRKQKKESINNPEKKLKTALQVLHDIVQTYKAKSCKVHIDGIDYSGKFLLAEVMNIRSIGPNLNLAPFADPGDGLFEVVLIPEEKRREFLKYLESKVDGNERLTFFHTFSASRIEMMWQGRSMHIDDEEIKLEKAHKVNIEMQRGALKFLVPSSGS